MNKNGLKLFVINIVIGLAIFIYIGNRTTAETYAENNHDTVAVPGSRLPTKDNASIVMGDVTSQDNPAEEVYKNIRVFKGLPTSKLRDTMFYMRGALGVSCTHCHVNFNDFEKDDKPAKQTARRMIEMTRELNQKNFGGENVITCNTCHRGQTEPLSPLAFAPIRESRTENKPAETKAIEALPTVEQIFDRYLTAAGGRAANEKLKTRVMNGSISSSEGWKAPLRIYKQTPNKYLVTFDIKWTSYQAFNGVTGWSQDNGGLHDIIETRLALLKRESALFSPLELKEQYSKLIFLGREKINERETYVVEGILPLAGSEKLFFDVESALLVRITSKTETYLGELQKQTDITDYRQVDGVRVPFTIIRSAPDFSSVFRLAEVKHNIPIIDIKFDKPTAPLKSVLK